MILDNYDYTKLIFRNQASTDYGILIQYPFNLVHATPDIDASHIKGRNGDFLQDNNSYQNVTETFNVVAKRSADESWFDWERAVTNWLYTPSQIGNTQYEYLKISEDPNYVFNAIVKDPPTFTKDSTDVSMATGTISFYCEPFMYRTTGIEYTEIPSSGVIYNEEQLTSIPNWHFIANGSFTVTINDLPYVFDNMEGEFWLNGDTGDAYDATNNLYNSNLHFPNLEPPILYPGKNTISFAADQDVIQLAEYKPRWRRLI